ncbi:BOLL [Branchiostoma lanceolatum]|uniref:Protein boule-like n=1 Tax=Branchiostoma lanceolatum TaxID=7740 RepID=A0A8J9YR00_BRALA|nr:BOLL [Branchiostoma lanceolatum]
MLEVSGFSQPTSNRPVNQILRRQIAAEPKGFQTAALSKCAERLPENKMNDQPADASASAAALPTSNACTPAGPMHLTSPVYPWWHYQHVQIGTLFRDRVFVRGFDPDCSEQELRDFFSQFGAVRDTKIIADRAGVSKGYGFVTFDSQEAADKAQQNDNLMFKDKRLNVGPAIRKQSPSLPSPFRPESSCSPYLTDIGPSSSFVNNWSLPYGYMCPDSYLPQQTIVGPSMSVPPSLSPAPIMLPAGPPTHQPCNMYMPQAQPHQPYYPNTAAGQQYSTSGREWAPQSPPAAMQAPQPMTYDGYGPMYQEMVPVEMPSYPQGCIMMAAPNLPPEATGYISMSGVPIMQQVQEVNPPPEQAPPPPVYTQHTRRPTTFHGPPPARRFTRVGTGRPRTLPARPVMDPSKSAPQEAQPVPTLTPPPTPTPSINN